MNCWAFSRAFAFHLLYQNAFEGTTGFIAGHPGPASAEDLLLFLNEGGPWVFVFYGYNDPKTRPFRVVDVLLEALFHQLKIYHQMRGPRGPELMFSSKLDGIAKFWRLRRVLVTPTEVSVWKEDRIQPCHKLDIPHSFGISGLAYDVPENPHPNSLSRPGDSLYLLTPPIVPPRGKYLVDVYIRAEPSWREQSTSVELLPPSQLDSWMTYGLVRQDDEGGKVRIVQRWRLEKDRDAVGHMKELFRPGDMIGLWACGPPVQAENEACDWKMVVDHAFVLTEFRKAFKEARCDTGSYAISVQNSSVPHTQAKRLEFGRFVLLIFTSEKSCRAEGEDFTFTGLPHSFDPCGLAIDLDTPLYSDTLCEPGDFLYLLTSPIQLNPKHKVLSVTVYTWSAQYSLDETGGNSLVSFEIGGVRLAGRNGLRPTGPRYEVSRNFHLLAGGSNFKRHRNRMDNNHPVVRDLMDGDMIGLWVRVRDNDSACVVRKSLIVVETGQETNFMGRCMRFVNDEIRDVVDNIRTPAWGRVVGAVGSAAMLFAGLSIVWKRQ